MPSQAVEFTTPNNILQLGEATINLARPQMENQRLEIISEVRVAESIFNTPLSHAIHRRHTNISRADNVLEGFELIMDEVSDSLTQKIESDKAIGLKVLLVTPETFKAIRRSNPAPDWAGVYVMRKGVVIYNAEYVKSVLGGDGNFGEAYFTLSEFYEEAVHELGHNYASSMFYQNDENLSEHFGQTSLWYNEGLSEALGRHITGLTDSEFIASLREIRILHPDFSIETLNKGFFLYDKSLTSRNIAYQYCGRFLRHFAQILTKRLGEKNIPLDSEKPYQAAYWLLNRAVDRYKQGIRESIIGTLEAENIMTGIELRQIERDWVVELLKQE